MVRVLLWTTRSRRKEVRLLYFLSHAILPNKRNRTPTKLECGPAVWGVKKLRQLLNGILVVILSGWWW